MKKQVCSALLAAAGLVGFAPLALAVESDFEFEAAAGVRYDSNINVEEADILVGAEDIAAVFEAGASYEISNSTTEFSVGYDFGQRLYEDFDQFDLQSHRFSAGAATELAGARVGATYGYSIIRLDNDPFLNIQTISPSVAGFIADKTYVRGYYRYLDKDFETRDQRDAEAHAAGATAFRFFMDSQAFLSLGGEYESENAVAPEFDFDGFRIDADLKLPFPGIENGDVTFGYGYRERDYANITPSIGEERWEKRSRFEAGAEIPIIGDLALEAEYQYTDRDSNFASSDYTEHLGTAMLRYSF